MGAIPTWGYGPGHSSHPPEKGRVSDPSFPCGCPRLHRPPDPDLGIRPSGPGGPRPETADPASEYVRAAPQSSQKIPPLGGAPFPRHVSSHDARSTQRHGDTPAGTPASLRTGSRPPPIGAAPPGVCSQGRRIPYRPIECGAPEGDPTLYWVTGPRGRTPVLPSGGHKDREPPHDKVAHHEREP
ncbi:proline-rich proteoglycan 2-like [Pogonomyrmex barbatus]|uniref:Proline-rich proteoglycan 2-like n=1 Tax=Pogonomyrmex barbatus TaxID=144034 RepID=A0A6I9VYX1_9HYME|nr:proline-rich proteoglycan 2-like [Pogonomyrmex barbatus]